MNNFNIWYIINDKNIRGIDFSHTLARELQTHCYKFFIPYSNILSNISVKKFFNNKNILKYYSNSICLNINNKIRLNQIKYKVVQNATNRIKKLLDINLISNSIDYIDISQTKIDMVSYLPKNKIDKIINNNIDPYNNKYRQEIKIGRLLKNHAVIDLKPYPKVIEKISNIFKSINDLKMSNDNTIKIVKGKDITKWYLEDNYAIGNGTLNKSCMRYKSHQRFLFIYEDNPDVCRLIIKIDPKTNQLLGRALLWKTNKGIYMDRVYTTKDYHLYNFIALCEKNNWLNRSDAKDIKLTVNLKNKDYGETYDNPYMDTFKFYIPHKNILTNIRPSEFFIYFDNY